MSHDGNEGKVEVKTPEPKKPQGPNRRQRRAMIAIQRKLYKQAKKAQESK